MYQYFAPVACAVMTILCALSIVLYVRKSQTLHVEKFEKVFGPVVPVIEKHWLVLLFLMYAVFLFTRIFRLDIIPAGIHMDELSYAYDARCLAQYGTDRYGIRMPVLLWAYGDGMGALYCYLQALLMKLFGFSIWTIRMPAAICGGLAFFFSYFLAEEIFENKCWAFWGPIMVTITPYFMMSERWDLGTNLFLSMIIPAFYSYYKAVKSGKTSHYVLAGVVLGITLNTYVLSYLILPLFLIFSTVYLICIKKIDFKKTCLLAVPLFVIALPLFLYQLVSMGVIPEFSFLGSDYRRLPVYRLGEMKLSNLRGLWAGIKLLLFGKTWITYNAFKEYGAIYLFSVPLVIYGFGICVCRMWQSFKRKKVTVYPFLLFMFIFIFLIFVLSGDDNMHKATGIFFPFIFFMMIAIKEIADHIPMTVPAMLLIFALGYLSYANFFYRYQNEVYGMHTLFISTELGDVVNYEEQIYNSTGKTVYVERDYAHQTSSDLLIGAWANLTPEEWSSDADHVRMGHIVQGLPDEVSPDEDAIYILGHNWDHIADYMVSEWGFQTDNTYPSYTILYR